MLLLRTGQLSLASTLKNKTSKFMVEAILVGIITVQQRASVTLSDDEILLLQSSERTVNQMY